MTEAPKTSFTRLLHRLREPSGDSRAVWDRLYALVYPELKYVAANILRGDGPGHILQPTALVHEAYLKLVDGSHADWQDRAHFLAVAARAMRQVLVDYARRRGAAKRGGGWKRVTIHDAIAARSDHALEIIELDDALARLSQLSERMARVAELRVFGEMTHEEIADVLSVSRRTAAGDWAVARRWLARELAGPANA
jgi:RNA polymerase sigma factor (TIGR02999 family)